MSGRVKKTHLNSETKHTSNSERRCIINTCAFAFSLPLSLLFTSESWKVKGQHHLKSCLIPCGPLTDLSICARNLVSNMPRVLSRSDTLPLSSRPLAVKSISTFLTISPKYMPLIIFSYLRAKAKVASSLTPARVHAARGDLNINQRIAHR